MVTSDSEDSAILIERFVDHQELHRRALRRNDVQAANRHMDQIIKTLEAISARGQEGYRALEALLTHPTAFVRLQAAGKALAWSPETAVPILGRLLTEDLGSESSIRERIHIRSSAAHRLYSHFGVKDYDQNKLIEPLKAYGIEIPFQPYDISI